jgi:hypothetical protein
MRYGGPTFNASKSKIYLNTSYKFDPYSRIFFTKIDQLTESRKICLYAEDQQN